MGTLFWSNLMEQIIGALKNEKVSGGILAFVLLCFWFAYGWANEEFVKVNDYSELTKLIETHVEDMRIVTASQLIRDRELELQISIATGRTPVENEHIKIEINNAKLYRECLIKSQPNCKHLKPQEW